jgi:hypothetical protein
MNDLKLSTEQKAAYDRDGYLIVKNFLSKEEVGLLYNLATGDDVLKDKAFDFNDQSGKRTKLTLWFTPGDDAYGLLTRPLPFKVDAKRAAGRRCLGMAPGLWILV